MAKDCRSLAGLAETTEKGKASGGFVGGADIGFSFFGIAIEIAIEIAIGIAIGIDIVDRLLFPNLVASVAVTA